MRRAKSRRPRTIAQLTELVDARWRAQEGVPWARGQTFAAAKQQLDRLCASLERLRVAAEDPFAPGAARVLAGVFDIELGCADHPFASGAHDFTLKHFGLALLHGADDADLAALARKRRDP